MKNLINYSNKQICQLLNIDKFKASELIQLVKNEIPVTNYKQVNNWLSQCYNRPSDNELKLCAINEILEGYGTEAIENYNVYINSYYVNIVATYVNMGETYINTILFDSKTEKFTIISMGDYCEKYNN